MGALTVARYQDALEAAGSVLNESKLASRRYASPAARGLAAGVGGLASGFAMRRALDEARKLKAAQSDFEGKIGIPFSIFSKLSDKAQTEILQNSGILSSPDTQPVEGFGGRSLRDLETQGAPSPEAMATGTGAFAGELARAVQTGPPMAPLSLYGKSGTGRSAAIDRYLGVEKPVSPTDQSLIESRTAATARGERGLALRTTESAARVAQIKASTDALRALAVNRKKPDAPVEDWELVAARSMGVPIPEGVTVSRKVFNDWATKFSKPVGAVVTQIDRLAQLARQEEITSGQPLSDRELQEVISRQTATLTAIAGDTAPGIVLEGVKKRLLALRSTPDVYSTPAAEPETGEEEADEGYEEEPQDTSVGGGY